MAGKTEQVPAPQGIQVDPITTPAPPEQLVKEIVREVKENPEKVVELVLKGYSSGYKDGLKAGLLLEERPVKKKSIWDF